MYPEGGPAEAAARAADAWLAEQAWDAGLSAGRAGVGDARYLVALLRTADGRAGFAAGIGLPGAGDFLFIKNAADALCDAFEMAAGNREDMVLPGGRYLPGHDVVTASGKAGILTGEAGASGYPRVQFADGTTATVPKAAIMGMVIHAQQGRPSETGRLLADGDVLLRPGQGDAAVMCAGTLVPATSRLASQMTQVQGGRYRESLLAARLFGGGALPATAVLLTGGGSPRPLILLEPPAGLAAAPQGQDEASLLTRLLVPRGMHVLLPGQETPRVGPGWALQLPAPGLVSITGPGIVLHKGALALPPGWEAAARARGAEILTGGAGRSGTASPDTAAAIAAAAAAGRLAGAKIQVTRGLGPIRTQPARTLTDLEFPSLPGLSAENRDKGPMPPKGRRQAPRRRPGPGPPRQRPPGP